MDTTNNPLDDTTRTTTSGSHAAPSSCEVAVVGAGIAGLTAAVTAARQGCKVVVLDARTPGGRARTDQRDGFLLNQGAHALYLGGPGARIMREFGVDIAGGQPPSDRFAMWWDGGLVPTPLTPRTLLSSKLLGPRSKASAARLLGGIGRAASEAASAPDVTFAEWLADRRVRDDLTRLLLTVGRTATYCARPEDLPARTVLGQLHAASVGVRYLDGGWQRIVDALTDAARRAGATIVSHAAVTGIADEGGEWVLDCADTSVRAGSVVIAAGGPEHAESLIGRRPGWSEQAGPTIRAACLDVGTDASAVASPVADYLYSADDPLYLSCHAPVARLAPDGHRLHSLLRYLGPGEELGAADARSELEMHARRAGLAAAGERAVERFLTSMTVAWGSPVVGTARPRGDELASEGIHVAGDWVGDHLLADASFDSGLRAGRAVARRSVAA